jgi:uncharacterized protein YcgI (DUF1989 family)
MFKDDVIDTLILIFMVAFLLSMGYVTILKEYKETTKYSADLLEQKNMKIVEGVTIPAYGDFTGTLTKGQVVLMSQVQDWYMPSPKTITIYDADKNNNRTTEKGKVEIKSTIDDERSYYGQLMITLVNDFSEDCKFALSYDSGSDYTTTDDDFWALQRVVNDNVE